MSQSRLKRSERRLLIVDHTKFEARSLEVVCPLDHLDDPVTDAPPPALGDALSVAASRSMWRALRHPGNTG